MEEYLVSEEEKEQVQWMLDLIPAEDRKGISEDDVLFVLDAMDDYLEEMGLVEYDEKTEEIQYLEGEVDETEQLQYVLDRCAEEGIALTGVQVQLIMDAEQQWGIEQGYYEEE